MRCMSVSPVQGSTSSPIDHDDEQRAAESDAARPKAEFEFAGIAYAGVHLPSGLLGASHTTTLASVHKDLSDFEGKLARLRTDLASPAMCAWASKHLAATKTGAGIGLKLATVVATVAVFKEKGLAFLATTEGMLKLVGGSEKITGLVGDCQTLAKQNRRGARRGKGGSPRRRPRRARPRRRRRSRHQAGRRPAQARRRVMRRQNPLLVTIVAIVLVLGAAAPGSMAEVVVELDLLVLLVCSFDDPRELSGLWILAGACAAMVGARALTGQYVPTPHAMWAAGHAHALLR